VLVFFECFFFFVYKNLRTEEDSTDIKSFTTTDNDEEETNRQIKESECNVLNYFEVNKIKQLTAFTL
jgi:hypothetical protein